MSDAPSNSASPPPGDPEEPDTLELAEDPDAPDVAPPRVRSSTAADPRFADPSPTTTPVDVEDPATGEEPAYVNAEVARRRRDEQRQRAAEEMGRLAEAKQKRLVLIVSILGAILLLLMPLSCVLT